MIFLKLEAFYLLCPEDTFSFSDAIGTGSTDMGDLSCIMPVLHPYAGGAEGTGHGEDYRIADPEKACVLNAKWQLVMLTMLLENGAEMIFSDAFTGTKNSRPQFNILLSRLSPGDTLVVTKLAY